MSFKSYAKRDARGTDELMKNHNSAKEKHLAKSDDKQEDKKSTADNDTPINKLKREDAQVSTKAKTTDVTGSVDGKFSISDDSDLSLEWESSLFLSRARSGALPFAVSAAPATPAASSMAENHIITPDIKSLLLTLAGSMKKM